MERAEFLRSRLQEDADLVGFAQSLIDGVRRNRSELDVLLVKTAENWSLERMAATDRNVLRLGAYEILFTETPAAGGDQRGSGISQALWGGTERAVCERDIG